MSTVANKRKEAPAEPFKRALGTAVRAIANKRDIEVTYAAGQPELAGNLVTLPEPSRVPGKREIAVIRGHADSLALTASCHDVKLHSKLAPPAGPARRCSREGWADSRLRGILRSHQ